MDPPLESDVLPIAIESAPVSILDERSERRVQIFGDRCWVLVYLTRSLHPSMLMEYRGSTAFVLSCDGEFREHECELGSLRDYLKLLQFTYQYNRDELIRVHAIGGESFTFINRYSDSHCTFQVSDGVYLYSVYSQGEGYEFSDITGRSRSVLLDIREKFADFPILRFSWSFGTVTYRII